MWILKLILIGAAGFFCISFGVGKSRKYRARKRYFDEILLLCDYISNEITFTQTPLLLLAEKYRDAFKSPLSAHLSALAVVLRENGDPDAAALRARLDPRPLNPAEADVVIQFLCALGKSDAPSQAHAIEGFKTAFAALKTEADDAAKRLSPICWKLGLAAAAAAALFII
jgi:stage III sporulation protein AB